MGLKAGIVYISGKKRTENMARQMDFTTETPNCCEIGDILQVEEHKLPTSYWYMIEHAYGASGNFKNRERLKTRSGKVLKNEMMNGLSI